MIKVNLTEKKKKFTAPIVLGVDLKNIPVKKIIFVFILTQVPLFFLGMYSDQLTAQTREDITSLREREKKLRLEVRKNKKIAKQLDVFEEQISDLRKRGEHVKQILKSRSNPRFILEKIARVMPERLWIEKLTINIDKEVSIEGGSEDYRSIGSFIKELNNTAFFNKNLALKGSQTKNEKINKNEYRYESFKIEGSVESFNPFLEGGQ